MNNFAFLDLGMPELLLVAGAIVPIVVIVLIAGTVYKGFMRGYSPKNKKE